MCIEDQYGDRVFYHCRMDVPFGLLFAKYLRSKGILPIGGLELSNGKRIRLSETPGGMGFDTGYHVIIFVDLLMFINHDDLEYQDDYPLTVGHKREGVLGKPTMRDAIDASIQRGHVIEIVPKGDEVLPPPHKHHRVQEGCEYQFYQWSLYTAHHSAEIEFRDHSEMEVLLEIKIICRSGKAAKNWLIKIHEWGRKMLFAYWLNRGTIQMIEILSSNLLVYRHGGEFCCFVGARIVAGITWIVADGMMMRPDALDNIVGRGHITVLSEVFHVNLPIAQKTKLVLEFCISFGNRMSLPHTMDFCYLQCAWDAANLTLQDLMSSAIDRATNPNDRNCPICLDPILLRKFRIPACGHPIHSRCWKVYKTQMAARSQVIKCPVCHFDTQGYCYQVRL